MMRLAPRLASLLLAALPLSQALAQSGVLRTPVRGARGAQEPPPPSETSIFSYEGFVEVQRAGEQTRRQVTKAPFPLADGDRVHTYRRGQAVVRFTDGSKVTLGPYTVFTIELQSAGGISLGLGLGRLRALVSRLKGREFKVRTAVAVASVRGTEFEVGVTGEGLGDIAVHEGLVAVANLRGDEILLGANQRLEVFADRMGRVEHFEGRPERGAKGDDKKPDPKDKKPDPRDRRGPPDDHRGDRGRLKEALEREIGHHLQREAIESRAAFEHKNALYQEGKTLIDAFGQRVRVEQFVTRPDPRSFKHVTLNFRDQRLDFSALHVTANAPLPADLKLAGNLWFSPTASKPAFYAVKQRWVVSNGLDSVTRMAVDGDSLRIEVPGQPIFNPDDGSFVFSPGVFHQTVFGNMYEFINAPLPLVDGIYFAGARPPDHPTMMWHMVPVRLHVMDSNTDLAVISPSGQPFHFFDYAFRTVSESGGTTGKMFVDVNFVPDPALARFTEFRSYINFQDSGGTGGNGILEFGERNHPGTLYGIPGGCLNGTGAGCVYDDKVAIGQWNPLLNGGKGGLDFGGAGMGIPLTGIGSRQASGDTQVFRDANGNNALDETGLDVKSVNSPKDPFLVAFALSRPRDFQVSENFIIDDFGVVQPNPNLSTAQGDQQAQAGALFETFNFERTITSNRFAGRKIDLVMVPHLFLQSGLLSAKPNSQGAPVPGSEAPGGN